MKVDRQEQDEARRDRIARAAFELFARSGLEATSAQDIARAAFVSRTNLYRYFPSKIHMLLAHFDKAVQASRDDALERLHAGANPQQVWDKVMARMADLGVRYRHLVGAVGQAVLGAARAHGTVISYDLNYRPSLWKAIGGQAKAQEVNREIAPLIDVMIGNEEDFTACLGFEVPGVDESLSELESASFAAMINEVAKEFPNFKVIATTMRTVRTATVNDWGALAWSPATGVVEATHRPGLEIMDRVGGGDSFASGLVFGLLDGRPLSEAVNIGAAHGALAMTTPGDTSMATKAEVLKLASGGSARVDR